MNVDHINEEADDDEVEALKSIMGKLLKAVSDLEQWRNEAQGGIAVNSTLLSLATKMKEELSSNTLKLQGQNQTQSKSESRHDETHNIDTLKMVTAELIHSVSELERWKEESTRGSEVSNPALLTLDGKMKEELTYWEVRIKQAEALVTRDKEILDELLNNT